MIIQINIYICDKCHETLKTTTETLLCGEDPVAGLQNDWNWEYDEDNNIVCPECLKKDKHTEVKQDA